MKVSFVINKNSIFYSRFSEFLDALKQIVLEQIENKFFFPRLGMNVLKIKIKLVNEIYIFFN